MGGVDRLGVAVITVEAVTRAPRQGLVGGRKSSPMIVTQKFESENVGDW
jgi:hypothetical protein